MIEETLFDAEEKMEKAVSVARDDMSSIRTGRANPGMFSRIVIDYYGATTPITQLASINVPEARLVVIKPYEASQLGAIGCLTIAILHELFLLCTDQSVKTGGDQVVAALQNRVGPSVVRGGHVRPATHRTSDH